MMGLAHRKGIYPNIFAKASVNSMLLHESVTQYQIKSFLGFLGSGSYVRFLGSCQIKSPQRRTQVILFLRRCQLVEFCIKFEVLEIVAWSVFLSTLFLCREENFHLETKSFQEPFSEVLLHIFRCFFRRSSFMLTLIWYCPF